jgi:20S proteasome subunit alpha 7
VQRARAEAQRFKETFDSFITGKNLASRLGLFMQAYTLYSSVRPFGASVLLAHKDELGPSLYMIEPSGLHFGYSACATGKGKQAAKTELEKLTLDGLDLRQAAKEAARIIFCIHDATKDKDFDLEMTWIGPETNNVHEAVPMQFMQECIEYAKGSLQSDMRD